MYPGVGLGADGLGFSEKVSWVGLGGMMAEGGYLDHFLKTVA